MNTAISCKAGATLGTHAACMQAAYDRMQAAFYDRMQAACIPSVVRLKVTYWKKYLVFIEPFVQCKLSAVKLVYANYVIKNTHGLIFEHSNCSGSSGPESDCDLRVNSFLTAHQHIIGYFSALQHWCEYCDKVWKYNIIVTCEEVILVSKDGWIQDNQSCVIFSRLCTGQSQAKYAELYMW